MGAMSTTASPLSESPRPVASAIGTPLERLISIDALRGFDMFWIIGADALVAALRKMNQSKPVEFIATQLEHVSWEGLHFEDLIFPLFVFIVGISLVFSLGKTIERHGVGGAVSRIIRRGLCLWLLGILVYGGLSTPFSEIRLLGVLQRIAICYTAAGLLFCFLKPRGLALTCAGLLLGYWALMALVPVPGIGAGHFEEGHNLANYMDAHYLPWRKWDGDHDPEGLLSTLPAIATCLLGVFAGLLLANSNISKTRKPQYLIAAGVAALVLGYSWGLAFPIIKKLWTSSYVLVAAGYSSLAVALFYWIIDIKGHVKWAQPFIWIGMNSITIYMIAEVLEVGKIATRFAGGDVERAFNSITPGLGDLLVAIAALGICFAVVRFLYQRRIFIRV
jgi:predicted acyltransferase